MNDVMFRGRKTPAWRWSALHHHAFLLACMQLTGVSRSACSCQSPVVPTSHCRPCYRPAAELVTSSKFSPVSDSEKVCVPSGMALQYSRFVGVEEVAWPVADSDAVQHFNDSSFCTEVVSIMLLLNFMLCCSFQRSSHPMVTLNPELLSLLWVGLLFPSAVAHWLTGGYLWRHSGHADSDTDSAVNIYRVVQKIPAIRTFLVARVESRNVKFVYFIFRFELQRRDHKLGNFIMNMAPLTAENRCLRVEKHWNALRMMEEEYVDWSHQENWQNRLSRPSFR